MQKNLRGYIVALLCILFVQLCARCQGQTTPQFDCSKQTDPFASYCTTVNDFLNAAAASRVNGKTDQTNVTVKSYLDGFAVVYSEPTQFSSLLAPTISVQNALGILSSGVNQNRLDQQTSAGSSANGTTSLVEKAGTPAILAFALESGTLTRSVSGNTATLTANADGLLRALTGQQILCFDCVATKNSLGTKVLQNVNLAAAFLIDQQSTSSVGTSGTANSSTPPISTIQLPTTVGKLSSISARYELWNPYDPHSSKFLAAWKTATDTAKNQIDSQAKALQASLVTLVNQNALKSDAQFQALLATYKTKFYEDADAGDLNKLKSDFLALYNATVNAWINDDPQFSQKIAAVNLSLAQYRALWQQILDQAKGKPLLTLEYAYSRPAQQPETHDFKLVFGVTPQGANGLLSVNAAISIYGGTIPAGAKYNRLHDGQISAEYDRPVTIRGNPNQGTFSLAGYWQYQPDPSVLNITSGNLAPGTNIQLPQNAQVLLGSAGSLWVTQAKFSINTKSGVKVPVAVKWANKTDLLSGNKIGAQVGISYDFSSLSSLFGGSSGTP
jgi:hypothetical protein